MNLHLLHLALLSKREELKQSLASREDIQIDGKLPDHLDEAIASSTRALAVDDVNRKNKLLKEVNHAISRLDSLGDHLPYGLCESCEEGVSPERLTAVPWARLCITCQIELEQQEAPGKLSFSRRSAEDTGRKREAEVFSKRGKL